MGWGIGELDVKYGNSNEQLLNKQLRIALQSEIKEKIWEYYSIPLEFGFQIENDSLLDQPSIFW